MKPIISPIDNPTWRWGFVDGFYLSIRKRGDESKLLSTRTKDKYWVGHTEVYYLEGSPEIFHDDGIVVCHVFKIFGKYPAMQNWGFLDELESGGGEQAIFAGGRWFLMEKGDEMELSNKGLVAPFKEITISIQNKDGIIAQVYKK